MSTMAGAGSGRADQKAGHSQSGFCVADRPMRTAWKKWAVGSGQWAVQKRRTKRIAKVLWRLSVASSHPLAVHWRLPTAQRQLLLTAHCRLPTAHFFTADCRLPTAHSLEAFERQGQMAATFVPGHGVDFIDDDGLGAAQHLPALFAGE